MLRIENFTKAYTPGKPAVKDLTLPTILRV